MWIETVVFHNSFGVEYEEGDENHKTAAFWSKIMINTFNIGSFTPCTVYTENDKKIECVEIESISGSIKIGYEQLKTILLTQQEIQNRDNTTDAWLMANSMEVH